MAFNRSDVSVERKRSFPLTLSKHAMGCPGCYVSLNLPENDGCVACPEQNTEDHVQRILPRTGKVNRSRDSNQITKQVFPNSSAHSVSVACVAMKEVLGLRVEHDVQLLKHDKSGENARSFRLEDPACVDQHLIQSFATKLAWNPGRGACPSSWTLHTYLTRRGLYCGALGK
jgi:hypothetical protein